MAVECYALGRNMVKNKILVWGLCLLAAIFLLGFAVALTADYGNPTLAYGSGGYLNTNSLTINVTSDMTLANATIRLYNSSADLVNQVNITDPSPFITTFSSLADGLYLFNATLVNSTGTNSTVTKNVTIDTISPVISFTGSEASGAAFYRNNSVVNITVTEANFANVTVRLYNSTDSINSTFSTSANVNLNYTNLPEGRYYYNVTASDLAGHENSTATRNFTVDRTAPALSLGFGHTEDTMTVTITMTDTYDVSTCTSSRGTVSGEGNVQTVTDDGLDCETAYTYEINCTDMAGNFANITDDHTTSACSDDDDGGDGGGADTPTGFWTSTFSPSNTSLEDGYNKLLGKGERVRFKIGNETHYVGVTKVRSSEITINVSSTPQIADIDVGETKKFEISGDDYYDVSVTLNKINETKANVTITSINEKMTEEEIAASSANETASDETEEEENLTVNEETEGAETSDGTTTKSMFKSVAFWIILIAVLLVAAGAIVYFLVLRPKMIQRSVKIRET
jgi:hypothetical protein